MMCAFLVGTTTACTNGSEQNKEETQKDKSDKASKKDKKDKKDESDDDVIVIDSYSDWSELESGKNVEMQIDLVWDEIGEDQINDVTVAKLYLVPHLVSTDDGDVEVDSYIALFVNKNKCSAFDKIVEETEAWYAAWSEGPANPEEYISTGVVIDGEARKMTASEKGLFYYYFEATGLSKEEIDKYYSGYIIDHVQIN